MKKVYPASIKYKKYKIYQGDGKVSVKNKHEQEILTIYTKRLYTREELKSLFEFNVKVFDIK